MKTLTAAAIVLVTALAVPAALAGPVGPPTFHDNVRETFVDPDFCGTGKLVTFDSRTNILGWVGETGGELQDLKVNVNYKATITNPANGASVIDSAAAQFNNAIISGQESGPHTHEGTVHGLPEKLQDAHGGVLVRDAGTLTYRVTYDADDNVTEFEILKDAGDHSGFQTGRWCEVATAALGL